VTAPAVLYREFLEGNNRS